MRATGEFNVNLEPPESFMQSSAGVHLNRMSIINAFDYSLP
jgi:hypothetical protein